MHRQYIFLSSINQKNLSLRTSNVKIIYAECLSIPAFTDNYIWAIVYGKSCIVVDPGDSDPVFSLKKMI